MFDYTARYFKMRNKDGEEIIVDRYDKTSRYKRMARAFVNYTQFHGLLYYKHITLTQAEESYKPNILNYFMNQLRRLYGNIAYIWTAEVQEERREKYGEAVLHWHLVVAFEPDTHFDKDDIVKIQKAWKYGNVDVKPIRRLNLNYILKYIQKALDTPLIEYHGLRVRKISMSRIPVMFRYYKEKIHTILAWFDCHAEKIGKFFKVDKKGIYYEWRDTLFDRWRKDYALILSSWQIVDSYDYDREPF